jgi:hypothetical protein
MRASLSNCEPKSPTRVRRTFFIYREIQGAGNSVARLNLCPRHGSQLDRPATNSAADFVEDGRQPFADQITKWWIALAPGKFYGQRVTMSPLEFPQLGLRGWYKIEGDYRSDGFFSSGPNNPLLGYKSEL